MNPSRLMISWLTSVLIQGNAIKKFTVISGVDLSDIRAVMREILR